MTVIQPKTTQQTTTNDDVSRERNGASGAENPLPPSPCVTSSPLATSSPPALFVHSSVRLFVWLVVALSLCPLLSPSHPHCVATPCRCTASCCHPSHLVVIESSCSCILSRLVPPLSSQDVEIDAALLIFLSWLDALVAHLPRCLLGDVYECICFGLVTVKECVNFRLVTCRRTVLKFGKK